MNIRGGVVFGVLAVSSMPSMTAHLRPETSDAWDAHVQAVNSRMQARLSSDRPFLWVDEEPSRGPRVRQGEILVSHPGRTGSQAVPHGLIHDWNGAVFIPGVSMRDVLAVLRNYDRYKEFYSPTVVNSKPLDQSGDSYRFSMLWMQKVLFVTAALDSTYESSYFALNDRRWYSVTTTTKVQEIQNYGLPAERKLPPDEGRGFLWKLYSMARFEERDGGVYVEVEAVGLSRDIPASLKWLVAPVVDRLSKDSVMASLRQTRAAVRSNTPSCAALAVGQ